MRLLRGLPKKIKLISTVTVPGSDNPESVIRKFATVDLLSEGRVEMIA